VVVCQVCFDTKKELNKCLIAAPGISASNPELHMKTIHNREDAKAFYDKIDQRDNVVARKKPNLFAGAQVQITLDDTTASDVSSKAEQLLYRFFNTANVSMNQTSNVHLHDLIKLLISKGGTFKNGNRNVSFNVRRYKAQENIAFASFVSFVTKVISTAREYYVGATGKHIPFLSVGHDGWDSKRRDILGVTVHLVHPANWVAIALPIGLKYNKSKKSEETVIQINKILTRYVLARIYQLQNE
jgi:hypothetical protein